MWNMFENNNKHIRATLWRHSGVLIVNFQHMSTTFLVFLFVNLIYVFIKLCCTNTDVFMKKLALKCKQNPAIILFLFLNFAGLRIQSKLSLKYFSCILGYLPSNFYQEFEPSFVKTYTAYLEQPPIVVDFNLQ